MDVNPALDPFAVYPDYPGGKGCSETSYQAAEAIAPKVGKLQQIALQAITGRGAVGLTADECCEATGLERASLQPRISELRLKGLVFDSGKRRRNGSGKSAVVWVCAAHKPEDAR